MQREMLVLIVVVSVMKLSCSSSDSGNGKGCYYKGKYHKQSWEDGCQYVCSCENIETGYLRCKRRCPTYKNIPDGCTLQLPPNEPCCRVPVCSEQTTAPFIFTMTQGNVITTTSSPKNGKFTGQHKPEILHKEIKSISSVDTTLSHSEHSTKQINMSPPTGAHRKVQARVNTDDNFKNDIVAVDEQNSAPVTDASHNLVENTDHAYLNTDSSSLIAENGRHTLGYQKSVDEIVPFDIASTEDIFLNFPIMEEIVAFDNHENIQPFDNSSDGNFISSSIESNTQHIYDTPEPIDLIIYDNVSLEVPEQQINTNNSKDIQFAITKDTYLNDKNELLSNTSKKGFSEHSILQTNSFSSVDLNKTKAIVNNYKASTVSFNTVPSNVSNVNNKSAIESNETGFDRHIFSNSIVTSDSPSYINESMLNQNNTVSNNINHTMAINSTSLNNTRTVESHINNTKAVTSSFNNTRTGVSDINNSIAVISRLNNTTTNVSNMNNTGAITSGGIHGQMKNKYNPKNGKDDGSLDPKIKGTAFSNLYPRTNMRHISSGRCVFMGMMFDTRQTWFDGCSRICMCLHARLGFFKCIERCPVFKRLPKGCVLKASPNCCPLPACKTSTPPKTQFDTNSNARYRPLSIADRFNLRLANSKTTNIMNRLTLYTKLPQTQLLSDTFKHSMAKTDASDKMSRSNSVQSAKLGPIHTATGTYRLSRVIGSKNRREGNLVPVVPRSDGSTEESALLLATNYSAAHGNLNEAENSTRSWQTMIGFCVYNSGLYKPGERWEIGCELVCECLPGIQGNYDCKRRCPVLPVIPHGCSVQRSPTDSCCYTTVCPTATRRNTTPERHAVSKNSSIFWQKMISRKVIQSNQTTTESARNRNPLALDNPPASNKLSSLGILAAKPGIAKSSPQVNQTVVTMNFNDIRNTGRGKPHSNRVNVIQTGAVLISKSNKNPKTSPIHIALRGCSVGNKIYRKGQSWKIGCRFRCFCMDEIKQTMSCTHLCPRWKLPKVCTLKQPSKGRCCPVPKCPDGYVMKYPDGYVPL